MNYHLQLESVSYQGSIGNEWEFRIGPAESPVHLRLGLQPNATRQIHRNILAGLCESEGAVNFQLLIEATEVDKKISDKGFGMADLRFDNAIHGQPQTASCEMELAETRTEGKGPKETCRLTFNFSYTVTEADSADADHTHITPAVILVNDLDARYFDALEANSGIVFSATALENEPADPKKDKAGAAKDMLQSMSIKGQLYRSGKSWKIKPLAAEVQLHWGINPKRVLDQLGNGKVNEEAVTGQDPQRLIDDFKFYIEVRQGMQPLSSVTPPHGWPLHLSNRVLEAHESVHVMKHTHAFQQAWREIQEKINDHIVGDHAEVSQKDAEKRMQGFLDHLKDNWLEAYYRHYRPSPHAHLAGVEVADSMHSSLHTLQKKRSRKSRAGSQPQV